jgi:hypothetical protein
VKLSWTFRQHVPPLTELIPRVPLSSFSIGSGGTNDGFSRNSGVHDANMIGVYPQGEAGWNTGPKKSNNCHWSDYSCTTDPDEGDFIAHIISEIRSMGGTGNIYAKGNSNGQLKIIRHTAKNPSCLYAEHQFKT